ncbi:hypothetical protein J6590_052307 [Homalodisca vitripennis]|nr:hypothetical protein J6590_052307 [Homalodisca vitripennis]
MCTPSPHRRAVQSDPSHIKPLTRKTPRDLSSGADTRHFAMVMLTNPPLHPGRVPSPPLDFQRLETLVKIEHLNYRASPEPGSHFQTITRLPRNDANLVSPSEVELPTDLLGHFFISGDSCRGRVDVRAA